MSVSNSDAIGPFSLSIQLLLSGPEPEVLLYRSSSNVDLEEIGCYGTREPAYE